MSSGAKWWKFDFHTHTPASNDYGKGKDHEELKKLTPEEWLLAHMKAEIDCVAVTDHNSGHWIDVLNATLKRMEQEKTDGYRPLYLFPGVEISVHGGIHLLAIFDLESKGEQITQLLGLSDYHGKYGETEECTKKTFSEVVDCIHKLNGIAIPAHVDQPCGLFKDCEGITLKQNLKSSGILAMQICNADYEKPAIYQELKLNFSEVGGSDSHHPEQIGKCFTWVKMEKPNLEALKLALHDGEDAILHSLKFTGEPNNIRKRYYIKNIEIKKASKAGRGKDPLQLNFSPWFSTIIGGRGSGKSSVLEFLRLVLNKELELPLSLQTQFEEFSKVSTSRGQTGMLLDDTEIRVEIVKDGREIALVWRKGKITEHVKNIEGNWEDFGESSDISQRFPIRLYSQKQLYELTRNPNELLQMIDKQFDKDKWLKERKNLESQWLTARRENRDLNNKLKYQKGLELNLKDTEAKLKLFEELGHIEILKDFQNISSVDESLELIKENIQSQVKDSNEINKKLGSISLPHIVQNTIDDGSREIITSKLSEWSSLINDLNTLLEKMNTFEKEFESTLIGIPWEVNKQPKLKKYEELIEKLSEAGETDPKAYTNLLIQKQEIKKELSTLEDIKINVGKQKDKISSIYTKITEHEVELRAMRKKVITKWNLKNDDLRIKLSEMDDSILAESNFRKLIRKEGITFARDICERNDMDDLKKGFIFDLYNMEPKNIWKSRMEAIKGLVNASPNYSKKFNDHIASLKESSPEDLDKLYIWFPEDLVSLNLRINGKEENIEVGSAGQRTAAMLSLLLSIDDTPLIIDQPEDDLDTRRITDLVVKGLRKLKNKQQIIVVTHNPNIPVNGSAEMIIHLNFARGMIQVKSSGALQEKEVRKAVCDVMEGGSEALNNRYFRIFKALE